MQKTKITGSVWIKQIFDAKIVKKQGMARRNKKDVQKYASIDELLQEADKRNWHVIENGNQYIILCNKGSVTIHL